MVRSNDEIATEAIDAWCNAVNSKAGSLLLGEITATDPYAAASAAFAAVPLWPSENHRHLMNELLANVVAGRHIHMFSWNGDTKVIRIYGPCVDLYWPAPILSEGFRTDVEGLSVIGDATGMSRGILQAMASGAGWALMENYRFRVYDGDLNSHRDSPAAA